MISVMHDYLDRQRDVLLKEIFEQFSERSGAEVFIRGDGLSRALVKLDMNIPRESVVELMETMDLEEKGGLDFEEFKRAVAQPLTQLEQWASVLPLGGMLARSLQVKGGQGDQPLRDFSRLGENEINTAVEAFKVGLKRLLLEAQSTLSQMFKNVDEKASEAARDSAGGVSAVSKFKTFKMSTGQIADYYDALSSRIGNFF